MAAKPSPRTGPPNIVVPQLDSDSVCRKIAREGGGRCLLLFSGGKDAVASWLQLRAHGIEVLPLHFHLVPGLPIVEEALAYYEAFFGERIRRVPHPRLYQFLREGLYQPPGRMDLCAGLPEFDFEDGQDMLLETEAWPLSTWRASGVRAADSPLRRSTFNRHGAIRARTKTFYPVWDWDKARLVAALHSAGVKLSAEYRLFGRSFDGLDCRFTKPLKDHRPADYARILEFFPMVEADVFRWERALAAPARVGGSA